MRKILLSLAFTAFTTMLFAQSVSVEKSTFGIQIGFLGLWAHNEARLTDKIALRSEIGLDTGLIFGLYNESGFVLTPVLTLEPRFYYNLDKREGKGKSIAGNSGNFVSIKTSYHPDLFVISNYDNVRVIPSVSIVPTWGIRRVVSDHFTYETGIGLGYVKYFSNDDYFLTATDDVTVNLHLRVGYRF